jgi:hypothetical protein
VGAEIAHTATVPELCRAALTKSALALPVDMLAQRGGRRLQSLGTGFSQEASRVVTDPDAIISTTRSGTQNQTMNVSASTIGPSIRSGMSVGHQPLQASPQPSGM